MIKTIQLTNFMSHADTTITLEDGLNVLVGENNCGKSAIIAALHILCRNPGGGYMVRHDTKECTVRVVTQNGDDEHEIIWRRKGSTVSYTIDGTDYHRLGRGIPDRLHELLRLPMVEFESDHADVHFAMQKEPIFLLSETAGKRAQFFASSSDASRLIEMQQLHRSHLADAKSRSRALAEDIAILSSQLEALEPVADLETRFNNLEHQAAELNAAIASEGKLADLINRLADGQRRAASYHLRVKVLRNLKLPPAQMPTATLAALMGQIKRESSKRQLAHGRIGAVESLPYPPSMHPTQPLAQHVVALAEQASAARRHRVTHTRLATLTGPPTMGDFCPLVQLIARMRRAASCEANHRARAGAMSTLLPVPRQTETGELARLLTGLKAASNAASNDSAALTIAANHFAAAEGSLRDWAETVQACPTCGQKPDPDQLVASAIHSGGHCQ